MSEQEEKREIKISKVDEKRDRKAEVSRYAIRVQRPAKLPASKLREALKEKIENHDMNR